MLLAVMAAGAEDRPLSLKEMAERLVDACSFFGDGNEGEVSKWLARGADPNSIVEGRMRGTPLNAAASSGNLGLVKLLLQHGARANLADSHGQTPLHLAADGWKPGTGDEIAKLLIEAGADVNAIDSWEATPLELAARHGPEAMAPLVTAGAKADRRAIMEAARYWRKDSIDWLLQHGAPLRAGGPDGPTLVHAIAEGRSGWYPAQNTDQMESDVRRLLDHLRGLDVPVDAADADGSTPLHLACESGQTAVAEWLLEHGADANKAALHGFTPLMIAVQTPYAPRALISHLVARGARSDTRNVKGETAVDCALFAGNWGGADALLRAGARPAPGGTAALFVAAEAAHGRLPRGVLAEILGPLLEGRSADMKDADGTSLLIWCMRAGDPKSLHIVLQTGASSTLADAEGRTPLHWAAILHSDQMEKRLLDAGASSEARDAAGRTPADYRRLVKFADISSQDEGLARSPAALPPAEKSSDIFAAIHAHDSVRLRAAVAEGQSALMKTRGMLQPLQYAAMLGWTEGVKVLLDAGAAKLLPNDTELPAALAARNGHGDLAVLLLKQKGTADPTETGDIFLAALANEQLATVRHLMTEGLSPWKAALPILCAAAERNDIGLCQSVLPTAMEEWEVELGKHSATDPFANRTLHKPLAAAASADAADTLRLLLTHTAKLPEPKRESAKGDALVAAAEAGALKAAKILLQEAHVDPNAGLVPNDGPSYPRQAPLSQAVAGGHAKMVELLLQSGAKIAPAEAVDGSLLAIAMDADQRDLFFLLLRSGADPNAAHVRLASVPVLHSAVDQWDDEIAKALVDAGADPGKQDSRGQTAIEVARDNGRMELAQWLEDRMAKQSRGMRKD